MRVFDFRSGAVSDLNPPACQLAPDVGDDDLASYAGTESIIGIGFSRFADGRGFSLARLLRDSHAYSGTLVALGSLIPDQAAFLHRSGFDSVELVSEDRLPDWIASLDRFPLAYQQAYGNTKKPIALDVSQTVAGLELFFNEHPDLEERLDRICETVSGRIMLSTSLQMEDQAIFHAFASRNLKIEATFLDTGRHFPETFDLIRRTEARYGVRIRVISPDASELEDLVSRIGVNGFRDEKAHRLECCEVRKVRPLKRVLAGSSAWITGLRRAQSQARAQVPFAQWDPKMSLLKLNPLADWSQETLQSYLQHQAVPVHSLYRSGFQSIGCQPCTRAVGEGDDPRSGRWWWERDDQRECGLHPDSTASGRGGS